RSPPPTALDTPSPCRARMLDLFVTGYGAIANRLTVDSHRSRTSTIGAPCVTTRTYVAPSYGQEEHAGEVPPEAPEIVDVAGVHHSAPSQRRRRHHDGVRERRSLHRAESFARCSAQIRRHVLDEDHREDLLANVGPAPPPFGVDDGRDDREKATTNEGA